MSHDAINSWIEKAKASEGSDGESSSTSQGVQVIKRVQTKSRGNLIMEIADRIFPGLMEMFKGVHNEEGIILQPAHVRGMALNVAQDLVSKHEKRA